MDARILKKLEAFGFRLNSEFGLTKNPTSDIRHRKFGSTESIRCESVVEINVEITWFFSAILPPLREQKFHTEAARSQKEEIYNEISKNSRKLRVV